MVDQHTSPKDILELQSSIAEVCQQYGTPDPSRWLATVMTGHDPRPMDAPIVDMIRKVVYREFDDDGGDPFPDESEWASIVSHVLESGLYAKARVPLADSKDAAKKLMDFLHKQQKSGTLNVKSSESAYEPLPPLTDKDVKRVKKIFNDVF